MIRPPSSGLPTRLVFLLVYNILEPPGIRPGDSATYTLFRRIEAS